MAMQPTSPRDHRGPKHLMRRLDHAADQINPFLLALAIGLAVLYATSLAALIFKLPVVHLDVCVETSASSVTHEALVK